MGPLTQRAVVGETSTPRTTARFDGVTFLYAPPRVRPACARASRMAVCRDRVCFGENDGHDDAELLGHHDCLLKNLADDLRDRQRQQRPNKRTSLTPEEAEHGEIPLLIPPGRHAIELRAHWVENGREHRLSARHDRVPACRVGQSRTLRRAEAQPRRSVRGSQH